MFHYSAFGLNFTSDVEWPSFAPAEGPADFSISLSATASSTERASIVLGFPGVGTFFVTGGTEICLTPHAGVSPSTLHECLAGPVLGALLQQRNLLVLHGSAVRTPAGAVLFLGASGSGKSTLAYKLYLEGLPLIADEVCAIALQPSPRIFPAMPLVLLQSQSERHAGKVAVRCEESFSPAPVCISAVYILGGEDEQFFARDDLSLRERFRDLAEHSYRPGYLQRMGLESRHNAHLAAAASVLPVIRLSGSGLRELSVSTLLAACA